MKDKKNYGRVKLVSTCANWVALWLCHINWTYVGCHMLAQPLLSPGEYSWTRACVEISLSHAVGVVASSTGIRRQCVAIAVLT